MRRFALLGSLVALLVVGLFAYLEVNFQRFETLDESVLGTELTQDKIYMTINFGDGKTFSYQAGEASQTVYDMLLSAMDTGGVHVDVAPNARGIEVVAINDYENTTDHTWMYFVNGEEGRVPPEEYALHGGDNLLWQYVELAK